MSDSRRERLGKREFAYDALAQPFRFPSPESSARFRSGAWQEEMEFAATALAAGTSRAAPAPLALDDRTYETEFIALFEVGVGGAPCPLHSGHYGRDRMINMEEVVRFYDFFDFKPQRSGDCYPDHITAELGFMAHLVRCERAALESGDDDRSPLRAQRDFASRHLAAWLPMLHDRAVARGASTFFTNVIGFTRDFVARDLARLAEQIEESVEPQGEYQHG